MGGTAQQRLDAKYRLCHGAGRIRAPSTPRDEDIFDQVEAEARVAARQLRAAEISPHAWTRARPKKSARIGLRQSDG